MSGLRRDKQATGLCRVAGPGRAARPGRRIVPAPVPGGPDMAGATVSRNPDMAGAEVSRNAGLTGAST